MEKTFKKVCLFFGWDVEARLWLKKRGYSEKNIREISKNMSDDELNKAIDFLRWRPDVSDLIGDINSNCNSCYCDERVSNLLSCLASERYRRKNEKRKAEIAAIDWRKVSLENLRLEDSDIPHYAIDEYDRYCGWYSQDLGHKREFTLFFCYNGKEYKVAQELVNWEEENWTVSGSDGKLFLGKYDFFKKMPENALELVRKDVTDDTMDRSSYAVLYVLVYNLLIKERLAMKKKQAAEKIVKEHLKEKIRYRLAHCYSSVSAKR